MPRPYSTYPNQKGIKIHRDLPKKGEKFLQIKIDNFVEAYRNLNTANAFALYLYLCANADGYEMAFSPKAVSTGFGMPESTARDQIKELINKGYLVQRGEGNIYDFYETPHEDNAPKAESAPEEHKVPEEKNYTFVF